MQAVPIPADRAAEMFHMNIGVWRHNDFVRRTYTKPELDELEASLAAIASSNTEITPVEWGLRRIVMERVET